MVTRYGSWILVVLMLASCSASTGSPNSGDEDAAGADLGSDESDFGAPDMGASPADLGTDTGDASIERASVFERGPYNVGHRRWDITYDAELEPNRTIKLSVWYPTTDEEGPPGIYVINYQRNAVIGNASVAIDGQAPLLVFSHGNASLGEQSYFMTEFWASHGWVVVSPYHTGNTVFDAAQDGGISLEAAPIRPQDISAALDAIYALDDSDPLAGKVSDDVVMSGHSFGGFTTLANTGAEFAVDTVVEACAEPDAPSECQILDRDGVEDVFRRGFLDPRIDVAIPQAPGGFFAFLDGISAIEIPTMLMTGARDITLPPESEGNPIWAALTGSHMRVDLRAGGHFTFSNMCELVPAGPVLEDGCNEDFIEFETAFEIINAYSLAFARYILWNDTTDIGLLDGTDERYAEHLQLSWKPDLGLN